MGLAVTPKPTRYDSALSLLDDVFFQADNWPDSEAMTEFVQCLEEAIELLTDISIDESLRD